LVRDPRRQFSAEQAMRRSQGGVPARDRKSEADGRELEHLISSESAVDVVGIGVLRRGILPAWRRRSKREKEDRRGKSGAL
jgi:hypothetical protein